MIDRIFSAALTFCLLAAGTLAVGSQMFGINHRPTTVASATVIELPAVTVIGHRERTSLAEAEPAARPVQ